MWLKSLFLLKFLVYIVDSEECKDTFSIRDCNSLLDDGSCLNDALAQNNCRKTCAKCIDTNSEKPQGKILSYILLNSIVKS